LFVSYILKYYFCIKFIVGTNGLPYYTSSDATILQNRCSWTPIASSLFWVVLCSYVQDQDVCRLCSFKQEHVLYLIRFNYVNSITRQTRIVMWLLLFWYLGSFLLVFTRQICLLWFQKLSMVMRLQPFQVGAVIETVINKLQFINRLVTGRICYYLHDTNWSSHCAFTNLWIILCFVNSFLWQFFLINVQILR